MIDQFGRKRGQKKRKDVEYKLLLELFQKYFVVHEQSAVKNSFSAYVCNARDGLFWLNLYSAIWKENARTLNFCFIDSIPVCMFFKESRKNW